MRKCLLLAIALAVSAGSLLAQQEVRFGQHRVVPEQNVRRTRGVSQNALAAIPSAQGKVNVLMQFREVPDAKALRGLEQAGVVLEGYVGGNAYYAQVAPGRKPSDFARFQATSVIGMQPEWKVSSLLSPGRVPQWADRGNGRVAVTLSWFSNVDGTFVKAYLSSRGYAHQALSERLSQVEVVLPLADVLAVAAEPWVRRVRPVDPPQELTNYNGAVLSAGRYLSFPSGFDGRGLTGKGVRVGLWDGNVENHIDFGKRLHVLEYEYGVQESGSHGIHTAGTIAGAGILNPKARGIAPEADLYSMNFNVQSNGLSEPEEMMQVYEKYRIALTSNSYGMGLSRLCDYYNIFSYGLLGKAYATDKLTILYPELTHIHAAGNDQGECGRKYGTSTKRAKNVIYVGAVKANGYMSSFSSWGPMDDGRLVPTVSAKGVATLSTVANNGYENMDGTSMACPTVSGIVTLLTERYQQLHGGQHMNSTLVRGVLANTADDRGNPGPDYQYGYGIVNGGAAVRVIENGWYRNDTLVAGSLAQQYSISVPAGVKQLRVMLTWNDPAVDKEYAFGDTALINDLDLSVSVSSGDVKPWVLNPRQPEAKATRGVDGINNIEQVTIDNPARGTAKVTVGGQNKIREGLKQGYTLTWYFDYGKPLLLHPIGGELFSPGEDILLRADNMVGATKAEISYDGGKTFVYIGKVSSFYSVLLTIPDDVKPTVEGKVRLSDAAGNVLVNEKPFTIVGQPKDLKFTASPCSLTDWKLTWRKVGGAAKYAVLKADVPASTWKEIGDATDTVFTIEEKDIEVGGRNVYAVAVKMDNGSLGPRSLGVLAEQPTPMTLASKDLPYLESFVTLPLPGASLQVGEHLSLLPVETPASVGFPIGSRMLQVLVEKEGTGELFKDPKNVFAIKVCKLDLSGVAKGTKLLFNAIAIMQTQRAGNAKLRLKAKNKNMKLTTGVEEAVATGKVQQLFWDLTECAGEKDVQLELEYACHEPKRSGLFQDTKSALLLVGYKIFEALDAPDVGIIAPRLPVAPKPNMGVEKVKLSLYSNSKTKAERVSIVVLLDGKVAATRVVKDLEHFEQREVEIPIDFTTKKPDGHIFNVEVRASVEGDVDTEDNTATFKVYNMGNVYPHPQREQQEKVVVDEPIVYTDNGGLLEDYSQLRPASIRFEPKDKSKVIQIVFTDWTFGESDSLNFYSTLRKPREFENEVPMGVLKGTRTNDPYVVLSRAADGGLYLLFNASRESHAAGWKAIVQAVPRVNYFTLQPLTVEKRYADGEAAIKIKVKNNTPVAQHQVGGEIIVSGETAPIAFEIPVVEANEEKNAETEYVIPTKVKVPDPSLLNLTVAVYGNDVDLSDNVQRVKIRNDKFWYGGKMKARTTQGLLKAAVPPSTVKFPDATADSELSYHLDKELVFFTETVNPLQITLQKEVDEKQIPATLHVWIDLDESGDDLKNEKPEYYSVALEKDKKEYTISVDLKGQKAGKRRMRIAVLPGNDDKRKDVIDGKDVEWGRILDITADIKEGKNPQASDLGLKSFTPIASGQKLSKEQELEVTIVNNGHTAASNFKIKVLVNGEQKAEETVSQSINPFGGELKHKLSSKVDLSVGTKVYDIELRLDDDDILDNNSVKQRVVSTPVLATDKLYALDFKLVDNERIDYTPTEKLAQLTSEATIEGWFYLRRPHFAWLFRSNGFAVASTYGLRSGIPDNGIIVLSGRGQIAVSKQAVLEPGQFHHLAVACKSSTGWAGGASVELEVFIDGTKVEMISDGQSPFNFKQLFQAVRFDGMVKMTRVWKKKLSETEIKEKMNKAVRQTNDGQLPEDCVAEFMMNEGTFDYIASGSDVAKLVTNRVDAKENNIWVDMGKQLITGVKFEGQLLRAKEESEGVLTFVMPHNYQVTNKLKGEISTLWAGTKVTYNGADVDKNTEFDFSGEKKEITLKATVELFGQKLEQTVTVRLVIDKSPEAKILKISLLASDNPNLKQDVRVENPEQTVRLTKVEDKSANAMFDASKCKITIEDLSGGAEVSYRDKTARKGGKLVVDLTKPALLAVKSENGRTLNLYTLQIEKWQFILWSDENDLVYPFSAKPAELYATCNSGLPVVYHAADEHVVTVDAAGKLHTAGVGETMLTAYVPASGIYAAATPWTKKVKVTPAPLKVAPKPIKIEEGEALTSIGLVFTGLQFNEPEEVFKPIQYTIYKDENTPWDPSMGTLPVGIYDVKPSGYSTPYVDGNYTITLENGTLEVKPSKKNKKVTFVVVAKDGGAALSGAEVEIGGQLLKTNGEGKASVALAPNTTYSYVVSLKDYADSRGEVALGAEDTEKKIELAKPEVTIKYEAEEHGMIALGPKVQHLAKGGDTQMVLAVPEEGYRFLQWDDGNSHAERQDKGVTADATKTAKFDVYRHTLKYTVGEGGEFTSAEATHSQDVVVGQKGQKVSVTAKQNYHFAGWSDGVATLEREDVATADIEVQALFSKPLSLPLCENFEVVNAMPFAWLSTNESTAARFALWKFGSHTKLPRSSRRCATVNTRDGGISGDTKAGLQTPWLDISSLNGAALQVSYTLFMDGALFSTTKKMKLQYRTEENGSWQELKSYEGKQDSKTVRTDKVESSQLTGKKEVQFRWFFEAQGGFSGSAAIDNVVIAVENKEVMIYVAGDNGKVAKTSATTTTEKELRIEPTTGAAGESVTAVPDEGYLFDKWDDGKTDATRQDSKTGKFTALFKAKPLSIFTLVYDASGEGAIRGLAYQPSVVQGSNGAPVAAEATKVGYHFDKWSDDRTDNPRTEKDVKKDVRVTALFAVNVYRLTYTAGANGDLEGVATQSVEHGKDGTAVKAVANEGFHFVKWSDGSTDNPRTDREVIGDISVTAEFAENPKVATLTFVVKDDSGSAVEGAQVKVAGKELSTDATGKAAFAELELKEYSYSVTKAGYKPAEGKRKLEEGGTTVEVKLEKVPNAVESVLLSVVTLRPNPASATLYVEYTAAVEHLSVVTLQGEVLLQKRNLEGAPEVAIPLASVADGMYLLVVEGDGAQRAIPFVVTK